MFGTLGGQEIIFILVLALIVFGPRKLPEIGKSIGKMMAEFRKASNDFRRTLEDEVEAERLRPADTPAPSVETASSPPTPAYGEAVPPADVAPATSAPAEPSETLSAPTTSEAEPPSVAAPSEPTVPRSEPATVGRPDGRPAD
jgi:sec-independent protein translocase protein TatA